jgi:hypothetical protein
MGNVSLSALLKALPSNDCLLAVAKQWYLSGHCNVCLNVGSSHKHNLSSKQTVVVFIAIAVVEVVTNLRNNTFMSEWIADLHSDIMSWEFRSLFVPLSFQKKQNDFDDPSCKAVMFDFEQILFLCIKL